MCDLAADLAAPRAAHTAGRGGPRAAPCMCGMCRGCTTLQLSPERLVLTRPGTPSSSSCSLSSSLALLSGLIFCLQIASDFKGCILSKSLLAYGGVCVQGETGDGYRGALVAFEHVDCLHEHDKGFLPALAALLPNAKVSTPSARVRREG